MPTVGTRAGEVFYERRGQGPLVVMLHANLHDHHDYDPVVEKLSAGYTTITVDWPGHGRSQLSVAPNRVDAALLADTLAEFADALALLPAVYIGNSVGGYAATRLALNHPDRVSGLVLVNAGGLLHQTTAGRVACRVLGTPAIGRVLQPRLIPRYMKATSPHAQEVARRAMARARTADGAAVAAALWRSFADASYDLRERAGSLTVPTLIAWGADDIVLPLSAGQEVHRAVPEAEWHEFRTGHVVFASDPDGFVDVLTPFLTRTAVPAG